MFDTVSSLLSIQVSSHTIETSERLIFPNTSKMHRLVDPDYREYQPRMKFAGLTDKDLEKELSEAVERENEISEALEVLLKLGKDLIASGDIAAARLRLKRAADAGDHEAALALASTYDPYVLRELKAYGFPADAAMARTWYEKAKDLGSPVAPRRLELLTRGAR
jgi:TPR repeat protein